MKRENKEDFELVSYRQWLEKVQKELSKSGRSYNGRKLNNNLRIEALYPADSVRATVPRGTIEWIKAADFCHHDNNEELLEALEQGIESITVRMGSGLELNEMLRGVIDEYITTVIVAYDMGQYVEAANYLRTAGRKRARIWYSGDAPYPEECRILIGESLEFDQSEPELSLADLVKRIIRCIESVGIERIGSIVLSMRVGIDFNIGITKLRAMRLLWSNVLAALSVEHRDVFLDVITDTREWKEDPDRNLILSTSQAMSALLGSANRLCIVPVSRTARYRRMAINIHHLLERESYFTRYDDAVSGSHYYEHVSRHIAHKAWEYCKSSL